MYIRDLSKQWPKYSFHEWPGSSQNSTKLRLAVNCVEEHGLDWMIMWYLLDFLPTELGKVSSMVCHRCRYRCRQGIRAASFNTLQQFVLLTTWAE